MFSLSPYHLGITKQRTGNILGHDRDSDVLGKRVPEGPKLKRQSSKAFLKEIKLKQRSDV